MQEVVTTSCLAKTVRADHTFVDTLLFIEKAAKK